MTVNNSECRLTTKSLDFILCYVNIKIVTDKIIINYSVTHITEKLFSCLQLGLTAVIILA